MTTTAKILKEQNLHKTVPAHILKIDAALGIVEAVVSVMGVIDLGDDVIDNGAYTKTLQERAGKIRVLDNHQWRSVSNVVGKPLEMREVSRDELPAEIRSQFPDATGGLYTKTQYFMDDDDSRKVFHRISNGVVEYSIGFDIMEAFWEKRTTSEGVKVIRRIKQIRLIEYSPVILGMNEATATISAKTSPKGEKGKTDADRYRAGEGATQCQMCRFYRAVDGQGGYCQRHDFDAGAEMVCDSFAAKSAAQPGHKERDGSDMAIMRLGDYLMGCMRSGAEMCYTSLFRDGWLSEEERKSVAYAIDRCMETFSASMPNDLMYLPIDMAMGGWFMFSQGAADEEKSGRVLSSTNITDILSAVAALQNVLKRAGIAEAVDESSDNSTDEDEKAHPPAQAESPQEALTDDVEAEIFALQTELELLTY